MEDLSHSVEVTDAIGGQRGRRLSAGSVVAYRGGLGMGKTASTRGLARGLGCHGRITSPTFTIVNEYRRGTVPVFHFDFYRLEDEDGLDSVGFEEYLKSGICICEWCEKIDTVRPSDAITVTIEKTGEDSRRITVQSPSKGREA